MSIQLLLEALFVPSELKGEQVLAIYGWSPTETIMGTSYDSGLGALTQGPTLKASYSWHYPRDIPASS